MNRLEKPAAEAGACWQKQRNSSSLSLAAGAKEFDDEEDLGTNIKQVREQVLIY